jgi:hypothetical protein
MKPKEAPPKQYQSYSQRPMPWTFERASAWTFKFGKYSGQSIAQIAEHDRNYIIWGSANFDPQKGGAQRACQVFLAGPKGGDQ